MDRFFVADSYKNGTFIDEPFIDPDTARTYVKIKMPCERCGGLGIIVSRIENNVPIPIPVDGGVCYKCGGTGYEIKKVRAYSQREYDAMQRAKERRAERKKAKEEARKQELLDNAAAHKHQLALKLGFNEEEKIYLICGKDTFSIKDKLKQQGARFNPTFKWYVSSSIELPKDCFLCEVNFDEVYDYNPLSNWAEFKENINSIIDFKITEVMGEPDSEFYPAEEKTRLRNLKVKVKSIRGFDGLYGYTYVYTFSLDNYIFTWMTSKYLDINIDEVVILTGTIKKFEEYNRERITYLTRCIIKKEDN